MEKLKNLLRGSQFYLLLLLAVLVVGAGGYALLSPQADQQEAAADPALTTEETTTQLQQPSVPDADTPDIQPTISPAPLEEIPAEPEVQVIQPEVIVDDTPVVVEAPRLVVSPLEGDVVTAFSADALVYNETLDDWRTHEAIDIAAEAGAAVLAASNGTVASVEDHPLMGTTVVIDHADGCQTTYASLQAQPSVEVGDTVSAGQIIGAVGTTAVVEASQGPHLHFSVTQNGKPVSPEEFLD